MKLNNESTYKVFAIAFLLTAVCATAAWADMAQLKAYKTAYPDEKPKCNHCHVADIPKKDGNHDLNDYGKKVTGIKAQPDAETYKTAGKE